MKSEEADPLTIVAIGPPGHGKSTFGNELADADIFDVGSGGQSCTQAGGEWEARNAKLIAIEDRSTTHKLKLVDTPGFPDPDVSKAALYYDHVVAKCNEKINAVVFVLKPEREMPDVLERYAVLLREFVNLEVPLIILVNGTEPAKRKRESDEAYKKRREEGLENFRSIGRTVEKKAGLHAKEILVSYCIEDLHDLGKQVVHDVAAVSPRASRLRTSAELEDDLKQAEDAEAFAKREAARLEQRIRKCEEDIAALEQEIVYLKFGTVAAGVSCSEVPVLGLVATAALMTTATQKQKRVQELYEEIGDAERAKQSAEDLEAMRMQTQLLWAAFTQKAKYLRPSMP